MDRIRTIIVNGFLDAGKTSYIQDCIFDGFFHKRGSTLIVAFEDGETVYDTERLNEFRTSVIMYEGREDISAFLHHALEQYKPDRVYVEMNAMTADLREQLPGMLDIVFTVTLIDGETLSLYYNNMRQLLQNMIVPADMTIFNRCPDKTALEEYSVPFRIMNPRCDFLWQSEMGYSEKAFGRMLPYDIDAEILDLKEEDYAVFHLDSHENPDSYAGKTVCFLAQMRNRPDLPEDTLWLGRSVMTCCMQDIQFLGFSCRFPEGEKDHSTDGGWFRVTADVILRENRYHVRLPEMSVRTIRPAGAPEQVIIGQFAEGKLRPQTDS